MQHLTSKGCHNQLLFQTKDGGVTKDFMPVFIYDYHIWIAELPKILITTCTTIQSDGTSQVEFIIKTHSDSFEALQEKFPLENEMRKLFWWQVKNIF